ncbi:chemotaxis protein CheX [Evansella sp. AB-rgal1]|uniref:chemotaxis protein CheX n=1 Tax=Evansella sp. AB-rgal1 TaxID=3242696 RepID=UPI00359CCB33
MSETIIAEKQNVIIKESINGMISSIKSVIPANLSFNPPVLIQKDYHQSDLGVIIGITGDFSGQILIEGEETAFNSIAQVMYGMELEGEMLESFVGELGNQISGHMVTTLSQNSFSLNISPPTVIVGKSKYTAFKNAIKLSVEVDNNRFNILFMTAKEM